MAIQPDLTQLLLDSSAGNRAALDQLMPVVYDELRRMAGRYVSHEGPGHTLQTTALVHEAYLRLVDQRCVDWQNRAQFYGVAAQMMRRVLVDYARARHADKRGGNAVRVRIEAASSLGVEPSVDFVDLDRALNQLASIDPAQSRIVELRFFGGLTVDETAAVTNSSPATVKREWTMARAWLYRALWPDA
jgi:RNA polymerase sigma factor (TIGR02999 family)